MKKFPTIQHLASATLEEVNEEWAGLGYYRRAKFLHEGAQKVVNELNGKIPTNSNDLLKLPGIGKYTSGAISSIVFRETTPVVDGNVIRVLSRLKMICDDPKLSSSQKKFWSLSGELVDPIRPGCFNQALMDLGSTLCTAKGPSCSKCPIQNDCKAFKASNEANSLIQVTDFPKKVAKNPQKLESVSSCIFYFKNEKNVKEYLIVQRPAGGLLALLWEFPSCIISSDSKTNKSQRLKIQGDYIKNTLKLEFTAKHAETFDLTHVGTVPHEFSHIKQTIHVDCCSFPEKPERKVNKTETLPNFRWVNEEELKSSAISKGMLKCFDLYNSLNNKKSQSIMNHFSKSVKKEKKRVKKEK